MHKDPILLALIDDHQLILEGLQGLLDKIDDYKVVGTFTRGQDFLDYLQNHRIDIALLDISLPDINGMDLCLTIKALSPDTHVIGLSNYTELNIIKQMIHNGASGYLLKDINAQELACCLSEVNNDYPVYSQAIKDILKNADANSCKDLPLLTKREKEILNLIATGKTSIEISELLFLSPLTVETHRKRMMRKFETKNMMALVKLAIENNYLD